MAEKLYQVLQYIYTPLNQILYPYIANKKNIKLYKKVFSIVVIFNIIVVILLFFLSNILFKLLFSKQASIEAVIVFRIFMITSLFLITSVLLGYPFLAAMRFPQFANKSVIYGAILHFTLILSLII